MKVSKGFKQTEIGEIPEDWEVIKLIDTVDYIHGKAHEQNIIEFGKYTVVNSKFISSDGKIAKYSNTNHQPALANDVLTVLSDIPNGKALAKCFFVDTDFKYAVNQRVCVWRSKNTSLGNFLYHLLNRYKYFLALNDGVSQTNISNKHIESCLIPLPPLKEQQAIAEVLSDMDRMISQTEALIEKKKAIKQGMMQELLKPKKGWVTKKLGEVGKCYRGVSFNPIFDLYQYDNINSIRLLRSQNIQSGKLDLFELLYVNKTRVKSNQILTNNDIVICMANGSKQLVGKASEFRVISNLMYTYGAFMGCFRTDKSIAVPSFVALCFQTHLYRTIIDVILTGSSINNLNTSNIESIEFQFPNLPEQAQISNTIHDLTKEVDKLEQNISKLKLQKQGMMQALLTGRIRLT